MDKTMKEIAEDFMLHLQLIAFMLSERIDPGIYPFVVLETKTMRTNLCLN
jgi:hypothetical protein